MEKKAMAVREKPLYLRMQKLLEQQSGSTQQHHNKDKMKLDFSPNTIMSAVFFFLSNTL